MQNIDIRIHIKQEVKMRIKIFLRATPTPLNTPKKNNPRESLDLQK